MARTPARKDETAGQTRPKSAARKAGKRSSAAKAEPLPLGRRIRRLALRAMLGLLALGILFIFALRFINPPTTPYMMSERARLGEISAQWVDMDTITPVMARSVVAAEDANFCLHWGFDMGAIRDAIDRGAQRGASTITQQTVKNVFLWQGRSWPRKGLEALLTPVVEIFWSKERILELYLNVAEFGDGIFGVEAAAQHYFRVSAAQLTPTQAARLAAILPNPKERDPVRPPAWLRNRAALIAEGAATIAADGRASCFSR